MCKVKLIVNVVKAFGGMEVQPCSFLTRTLNGVSDRYLHNTKCKGQSRRGHEGPELE
jgi:hypothetical protein